MCHNNTHRWVKRYRCLESTSDVVEIFQHFGQPNFNIENASIILESFVHIYSVIMLKV